MIFLVLLLLILGACLAFIYFAGSPTQQYQSTDTPAATVSTSPSPTVMPKTVIPTIRATYTPTPTPAQFSPTPEATTVPTSKGKQKEDGAPTFVGG